MSKNDSVISTFYTHRHENVIYWCAITKGTSLSCLNVKAWNYKESTKVFEEFTTKLACDSISDKGNHDQECFSKN